MLMHRLFKLEITHSGKPSLTLSPLPLPPPPAPRLGSDDPWSSPHLQDYRNMGFGAEFVTQQV